MAKFAAGTEVSADRSRGELERLLKRYGASAFAYASDGPHVRVQFRVADRVVRFDMVVRETAANNNQNTGRQTYEQRLARGTVAETDRMWRALVLLVKAKLEAVASGILSFEEEFLPYTVLESGETFYEASQRPEFRTALTSANMTVALPGGRG